MSEMFHDWWVAHRFEYLLGGLFLGVMVLAAAVILVRDRWKSLSGRGAKKR